MFFYWCFSWQGPGGGAIAGPLGLVFLRGWAPAWLLSVPYGISTQEKTHADGLLLGQILRARQRLIRAPTVTPNTKTWAAKHERRRTACVGHLTWAWCQGQSGGSALLAPALEKKREANMGFVRKWRVIVVQSGMDDEREGQAGVGLTRPHWPLQRCYSLA